MDTIDNRTAEIRDPELAAGTTATMPPAAAVFPSTNAAQDAIEALRAAGVDDASISVMGRDGGAVPKDIDDRTIDGEGDERLTETGEAHTLRGVIGGGALGALLGVVAVAIPGPGTLAAAGALAATGTGFLLGAGLGGLGEVLTQHGIASDDIAFYEQKMGEGGVLVTVGDTSVDRAVVDEALTRTGGMRSATATAANDHADDPAVM